MKASKNFWITFAGPFLVLIGLVGFVQRNGNDRIQAFPVFIIGFGLIYSALLERKQRRNKILSELKKPNETNKD